METELYNELETLFKKTDKIIEEYIGKRCPEFNFGCAQCKLNLIYEDFKIKLANELDG